MKIMLILLYAACSALGLSLMKYGINRGFSLGFSGGAFQFSISVITIAGILLYLCSFLLSLVVMSKMNLTYFYPISAGLVYISVCFLGIVLLKERVQPQQWVAMLLILVGVVVMNWGSK